jgi:hypothetical protein
MGMRIEDLNASDKPLSPSFRHDLFATARRYAAEMKATPSGDKTVMALYRAPGYLRSAVEALSEQTTDGTLEPAATAALDVGLSTIRGFVGVAEIRDARLKVLSLDDAHMMRWFNDFPPVSVLAVDTDDAGEFRVHVPRPLAKKFTKLARALGVSISRLGIFALMAGLLHAPSLSAPRYRRAMVDTLVKFKAEIKRRAEEAEARAANATPRDPSTDQLWTAADIVDVAEADDAGKE